MFMGINGYLLINFNKNIRFKIYEFKFLINKDRYRELIEVLLLVFIVKIVSLGIFKKIG